MATSSSLGFQQSQNAFDAIAAGATDSVLVAAGAGKVIVQGVVVNQGDTTPSSVTFNSKGAGAGTGVAPPVKAAANGSSVLPFNPNGWFGTNIGEALTVTTGTGSTTGVVVTYQRDT